MLAKESVEKSFTHNASSDLSNRHLLILYGSQTGCAQDIAERIYRQARRRHFKTRVYPMDDYERENLINERLVIFICSTTGQGDEPSNMRKFWKYLLRKNLPNDILNQMNFAVFGLGDSSYVRYNWPAKKLFKRLLQLGAQSILPRGDGDDQHYLGIDGTLDPWLKNLWEIIMENYPLTPNLEALSDDILLYPLVSIKIFRIEFVNQKFDENKEKTSNGEIYVRLVKNERVTAHDHFQDVRHIELDVDGAEFKYVPGDVAVIRPKNLSEEVNEVIKMMDLSNIADDAFVLIPNDEDHKIPTHWNFPLTLRKLFEDYLDIFSTPRRSFFEFLKFFVTNEDHIEKLKEFCSAEGQDDLYAYNQRVRRTISEVLQDFSSAEIPLEYIIDMFPEIQPRQFSISSSLKAHPGQIHLTVAIVKYKTKLQKPREGIQKLRQFHHERGTMGLPASTSTPIILIGPVMRAFLEERIYEGATENYLFFGCRYQDKDYYYKDQWKQYVDEGQLRVFVAFSRDQDKKVYVQDILKENAQLVWDIVHEREGYIYISGKSDNMPTDVMDAFKYIFISEGGMSEVDAGKYIKTLEMSRRYQQEVW
ncbi:8417_t:CDS:10 [Dentiscutata erythropus]|uniref:NADPH-dependent diflavin oxidoreductase 1 n=1 Tax=Dentiscutata erythropus TaxID=1348616 RepID=A0A9N9D6T5_9GLOM|nr:8417_t:CDS:10 [Dentiscutata erythropus]